MSDTRPRKRTLFTRFATWTAHHAGRPGSFALAFLLLVGWGVSGPFFGFSDTWQLVVNTGTTIVTFLMVFLIQNTQNRDSTALHIKLDELIRASERAHNALLDLEQLEEKELERIRERFFRAAADARRALREGKDDLAPTELREEGPQGASGGGI